jgi:hypothetical protein
MYFSERGGNLSIQGAQFGAAKRSLVSACHQRCGMGTACVPLILPFARSGYERCRLRRYPSIPSCGPFDKAGEAGAVEQIGRHAQLRVAADTRSIALR